MYYPTACGVFQFFYACHLKNEPKKWQYYYYCTWRISHPKSNEPSLRDVDAERDTESKLLHPKNAFAWMVCNAFGKATEAKLLHLSNALRPMVCNASGKTTEAKLLHP